MCLPYVSSNIFRLDDHESWSFEGYWNLMLYQPCDPMRRCGSFLMTPGWSYVSFGAVACHARTQLWWSNVLRQGNLRIPPIWGSFQLLQLVKAWKTFHGLRTSSHGLPWLMISSLALFILFFCQVKCKHNLIFRCGLPWRIFHRAVQPQCDTQWLAMGDSKDWVFLPEERRLGGVLDLWRMQGFNSVLILKHYQEAMWSQTRHWRDKYLKRLWCAWWTFSRRWACWWPALKKWQVHISLEDPSTVDKRDVADWKTLASIQKLQFWLDGGWIPCCHLDFTEATHPGK